MASACALFPAAAAAGVVRNSRKCLCSSRMESRSPYLQRHGQGARRPPSIGGVGSHCRRIRADFLCPSFLSKLFSPFLAHPPSPPETTRDYSTVVPLSLTSWNFAAAEIIHRIVPLLNRVLPLGEGTLCSDGLQVVINRAEISLLLNNTQESALLSTAEENNNAGDEMVEEVNPPKGLSQGGLNLHQLNNPTDNEDRSIIGYRTADRVSVVRVPSIAVVGTWMVMVHKESVYNTKEDGMDSFKYAASLNEWDTWARHHLQLNLCPNLVHLQGYSKKAGVISIYSEWCQGGDVQALLAGISGGGGLDVDVVRMIGRDVLSGLSTLHSNGLVYGDMKPANIFIGGCSTKPQYKIGDFGTMREQGREHLHYFVSGFGFTPEYAAPEILDHGTTRAGPSADLWSFGVMMYELATGNLPAAAVEFKRLHEDEGPDTARQQRRIYLKANPMSGAVKAGSIDLAPELCQVLQACLTEAPGGRPLDATALLLFPWFDFPGGLPSVLSTSLDVVLRSDVNDTTI